MCTTLVPLSPSVTMVDAIDGFCLESMTRRAARYSPGLLSSKNLKERDQVTVGSTVQALEWTTSKRLQKRAPMKDFDADESSLQRNHVPQEVPTGGRDPSNIETKASVAEPSHLSLKRLNEKSSHHFENYRKESAGKSGEEGWKLESYGKHLKYKHRVNAARDKSAFSANQESITYRRKSDNRNDNRKEKLDQAKTEEEQARLKKLYDSSLKKSEDWKDLSQKKQEAIDKAKAVSPEQARIEAIRAKALAEEEAWDEKLGITTAKGGRKVLNTSDSSHGSKDPIQGEARQEVIWPSHPYEDKFKDNHTKYLNLYKKHPSKDASKKDELFTKSIKYLDRYGASGNESPINAGKERNQYFYKYESRKSKHNFAKTEVERAKFKSGYESSLNKAREWHNLTKKKRIALEKAKELERQREEEERIKAEEEDRIYAKLQEAQRLKAKEMEKSKGKKVEDYDPSLLQTQKTPASPIHKVPEVQKKKKPGFMERFWKRP